jgi:hypothetical protein
MNVLVYIVIRKTGQFDQDGQELVVVYDVKLTKSAADAVALRNPGTEVIKMTADKLFE